ncbi:MAG: hypothetical protein ITG04_01055 [Proteiniphilum sp.]|jgi:hypothetical protein|nr:hypothetical protein [Proteiniphilum sp.]
MKTRNYNMSENLIRSLFIMSLTLIFSIITVQPVEAHCDSYDGPVLKDASKALETNNVELIKKWIPAADEAELVALFHKTYNLKKGDQEVYKIVQTHFYETFVRLHRQMEGAPYTGLKPAGTTEKIVVMSDNALESGDIDRLLNALSNHVNSVLKEKYEKVAALEKVKNESPAKGRQFVAAYVDYTHSIEAVHNMVDGAAAHLH